MTERARGATTPLLTRALLLGLVVAVPLVVAPGTSSTRSFPRYALVVGGALVVLLLTVVPAARGRGGLAWRNGLHWPVLALVGWSAVSAAFSDDPLGAVVGYPGSYDGLLTIASLAILFFAAYAVLTPADVKRVVSALWFGAGGGVLAYGLVQVADRLVDPAGRGWDLVPPLAAPATISSTLGNPNHLAGFAAMVLPLGAALWALSGSRRQRAVIGAMGAVLVVELMATGSRGGWLATLAAAATLGLLFRPRLAHLRPRVLPGAVATAGVLLAVALALGAAGVAKRDVGSAASLGAGSTLDLRVELWRTAWRMAADHPIVGVGPDRFAPAFPDYATDRFRWRFGVFSVAAGAHNPFATALANLGVPGLGALLVLVAAAVRQTARAWWRLSAAAEGTTDAEVRTARLLLGGVSAALVGYLVQASLNTQPVSLSFVSWMLLALACVLCRTPVPAAAAPAVAALEPVAPDGGEGGAATVAAGALPGSRR